MIFINFAPCCLCYLSFFFSLLILNFEDISSYFVYYSKEKSISLLRGYMHLSRFEMKGT